MADNKKTEAKKKVNPIKDGVSYADFLKAIPKNSNVKTYLKGVCTDEQIDWIDREIELYKKLKK